MPGASAFPDRFGRQKELNVVEFCKDALQKKRPVVVCNRIASGKIVWQIRLPCFV